MSIKTVPIRAKVYFGDLLIRTPYVLSFSVSRNRNSISTFQVSLKIHADEIDGINDNKIIIYAGEKDEEKKIFTGYVKSANPSPCWDDPKYLIFNLSGEDILGRLRDERYTRRQIARNNKWAVITGVQRKAYKAGKFKLIHSDVILINEDSGPSTDKPQTTDPNSYPPASIGVPDNVALNFKVTTEEENSA
jgi:hypothetical protein